eukprot:gnl/TRDRNA2_/TRDRNA2_177711_c3_seq3.p1 gnl/TRDRNA2_/TRDRNA2_177711_c3~~gnl/TRDRNA2_/TRDRNA2_177711_c3_seq3.p1  ORF type:complete len:717 (+),score=251.89 gnl/TRDRNA2_/TRDRNA2_177711_c3_seq3:97-2151(+)
MIAVAMLMAQPVLGLTVESRLTFNSEEAKNRPVAKVIKLLQDMLAQMEKEAEEDQEVYDKFVCWCETNDKEKTKSIADAEARIENLTAKIEELTALSSQLQTELKNLEKETAKNQEALDKATAMRQKQLAEFQAEEKDMLGAISALKSAVTVLGKHNGASSLLQVQTSQMQMVASRIKHVMDKHAVMLKHVITRAEHKVVTSFLQAPMDYFDAEPTFSQSYAPQSGQIFGVLSQMKETFEANLSVSQKDEMTNQKAYEDLKAAKEEEITSGQQMLDEKTQELATTDEKNAESKEDIEDTKNTLSADEQFLMTLKEQCSMMDAEWNERVKTRNLEMEACSKALDVLTTDDARDLISRTLTGVGLLQVSSTEESKHRNDVSKKLSALAQKTKNPRIAALAYKARLDAFTKVKEGLNDMIADLLAEERDEMKQKDFCVDEFNTNQLQTESKDRLKQDLEAAIEDLTMTIQSLTDAIHTLKSEISDLQVNLKRAGEDREAQNKDFQDTVSDQRASQKLLQKALELLQRFYGKKTTALFPQMGKQPAGPPPPSGFKTYEKNAAAAGVTGMIQQIINDAKAMEEEAIKSEEDAQMAYESLVKETNAAIEAKMKDIVNKEEEKAKAEAAKVEREKELESTNKDLEDLANYKAELHESCDFLLKNFDIRQATRDEEVEGLKQAKAMFSGALP